MAKERLELAEMLGNLLADDLFFKLDQRLSSPNMFSIMKMEYQKTNYNSLLAYLLNPHENHGLEDRFLRLFLARALDSSPLEASIPTEGLSPIPYETVAEAILDWDRLDVLSADLRETMVFTDYPLGDEGRTVDLAIWNEQYGFALYVENLVAPKEGWRRYHGNERRRLKSHSQEYLLDLYRQWASEDAATQYQILPVFISMGDMTPDERFLTRVLGYDWMGDALGKYLDAPTLSSHSRILIKDFIEHLKRELSRELDKDLYRDLSTVSDLYGSVISRLHDHVVECSGCDSEDDLIVAFHDIYRRHRECIDALWLFTDSREFSILKEVEKEINGLGFSDDLVLIGESSTLSGYSRAWIKSGADGGTEKEYSPLAEVYFSASIGCCGIFVYREPLRGMVNKIWMVAQELAEERDLALERRRPTSRNFHLVKIVYDAYNPLDIARDFVRLFQMLNDIVEIVSP